ncbi:putative variant ionotropic glutamate receptor-like 5, partial [Homarus americanus]
MSLDSNPLSISFEDLPETLQEEFLEVKFDSVQRMSLRIFPWKSANLCTRIGIMGRRHRMRQTALNERARIIRLWVDGTSARAIAQTTGTSASTVYRWIHRWEQEGSINTKSRIRRSTYKKRCNLGTLTSTEIMPPLLASPVDNDRPLYSSYWLGVH